jgi:serine/threonine-protein phosphatase 2A activator
MAEQDKKKSSVPFVLFSAAQQGDSGDSGTHSLQTQSMANTAEFKELSDRLAAAKPLPLAADHRFRVPTKTIRTYAALKEFQSSQAYDQFLGFVFRLNESVKGKALSAECHVSPAVEHMVGVLQTMQSWVSEIPPHPHRTRFGNEAFVTWYDKMAADLPSVLQRALLPLPEAASADDNETQRHTQMIAEVSTYLINAVGDRSRIDYGTGHEAHFVAWMYCLERLGLVGSADYAALVLRVFRAYLSLMRALQETYWLEPAGSQGVWGLDDYHFLPFLWGSAQLIDHKYVRPRAIRTEEIVDSLAGEYLYLACIKFINRVKTGSLVEHSPMLVDISGVRTWAKVNEGMIRMYRAALLGKYPVMQHFLFGSLLAFESEHSPHDDEEEAEGHEGHEHGTGFSACGCVARVPSAIASKQLSLNPTSSATAPSSAFSDSLPLSPRSAKSHFFPLD